MAVPDTTIPWVFLILMAIIQFIFRVIELCNMSVA
jgi:hypothetical protein